MATFNFNSRYKLAGLFLSISLLGMPGLATSATYGVQSSSKATEWGFDFVEQFDGLQDWDQSSCRNGENACGNRHDTYAADLMPKTLEGQKSAWGYFSIWNTIDSPAPWIGSETASGRKVWRGNKSLTIDIGETNYGPSRFGLYMGDGYTNWSAFYMVWMPKNAFPTSCVGGSCSGGGPLGTYTSGQPYTYFAAYKFNTFSMNCLSSQCPVSNTYGPQTSLTNIKQYNYTPKGLSMLHYTYGDVDYATDGGISLDNMLGDWFGYELNVRNISNTQYSVNMWVYDKNGNSTQIMRDKTYAINLAAQGGRWDHFFLGGNNSNSWTYGPTMKSHYYVDDLIIDNGTKGRIGPRYFSKIGAQTEVAPPSPPANAGGVQTTSP